MKNNRIAAICSYVVAALIIAWFIATLYFGYQTRVRCRQIVDDLRGKSSVLDLYAYEYKRGLLDSTLKFNLATKITPPNKLKLSCDGRVVHGPLVMDWVRCWPTAAMLYLDLYYLDAETESRVAYLGSVKIKVSYNGKIRILGWPRSNRVVLPNGSISWRDVDICTTYMPDGRSFSGVRVSADWLQVVNRIRSWELNKLDAAVFTGLHRDLTYKFFVGDLGEKKKEAENEDARQRWIFSNINFECSASRRQQIDKEGASVGGCFKHTWSLNIKDVEWHEWKMSDLELLAADSCQKAPRQVGEAKEAYKRASNQPLYFLADQVYSELAKPFLEAGTSNSYDFRIDIKRLSLNTPLGALMLKAKFDREGAPPFALSWLRFLGYQFKGELLFSREMGTQFLARYPQFTTERFRKMLQQQLNSKRGAEERLCLRWKQKKGALNYKMEFDYDIVKISGRL